jgi:hypothetical protein
MPSTNDERSKYLKIFKIEAKCRLHRIFHQKNQFVANLSSDLNVGLRDGDDLCPRIIAKMNFEIL